MSEGGKAGTEEGDSPGLSAWKDHLEQLFEDLQNYDLPEQLLDDFEGLMNETVLLREEHSAFSGKIAALEQELFFLRSENATLKAESRETNRKRRVLTVQRVGSMVLLGKETEPPTPRAPIPPAPLLFTTPKSLLSSTQSVPVFKARYKLLFWTKSDGPIAGTVFAPSVRLSDFRVNREDLEKFIPVKASPAIAAKKPAKVVSLLPQRRALVIETALKGLGLSPDAIVLKLLTCDPALCENYDKLAILYSALPREEDIAAVQSLLGDRTAALADAFVLALAGVSGLKTLVDSIIFKATFDLTRAEMEMCFGNWLAICSRLRENEELKAMMQIVLALGNAFNEGHPRLGAAKAYRLDILEELASLRSPQDTSVSILDVAITHYLAQRREREKFYSKSEFSLLREVASANFASTLNSGKSFLQQYDAASKVDFSLQFRTQMSAFVQQKKLEVDALRALMNQCAQAVRDTHGYFCESEETDTDGCFLLFRHLHRFYELAEVRFQQLAVGKTGKRCSKRFTLTPSQRLSLKRMSRVHE